MKIHSVTGLLFGDEGKGAVVGKLCYQAENKNNTVVVRAGGGQNCGHKVVYSNEFKHIHNQIPSGVLYGQGIKGYINSETFDPGAFIQELETAHFNGFNHSFAHKLYINPLTEVTTPFDVIADIQRVRKDLNISSTATGFGLTLKRGEVPGMKLYVCDLIDLELVDAKLHMIYNYYKQEYGLDINRDTFPEFESLMAAFDRGALEVVNPLKGISMVPLYHLCNNSTELIFEGNQGVSLDKDYGLFPHVTRANTVPIRANALIKQLQERYEVNQITNYDVVRTYKTSHSNSPLCAESKKLRDKLVTSSSFSADEENMMCEFQKMFRVEWHAEVELLRNMKILQMYKVPGSTSVLTITCKDHFEEGYQHVIDIGFKAHYHEYLHTDSPLVSQPFKMRRFY